MNGTQIELPNIARDEWLSPKELAAAFDRNEESAYRWRQEFIPDYHPKTNKRLVRYSGPKLIFFHIDVVAFLEDVFRQRHEK